MFSICRTSAHTSAWFSHVTLRRLQFSWCHSGSTPNCCASAAGAHHAPCGSCHMTWRPPRRNSAHPLWTWTPAVSTLLCEHACRYQPVGGAPLCGAVRCDQRPTAAQRGLRYIEAASICPHLIKRSQILLCQLHLRMQLHGLGIL